MLAYIENLIRRFHGHTHEVAGFVIGYFDDPSQTHDCAHEIELQMQRKVELCGCQISILINTTRR